jgi:hypothetical protein
MQNAFDYCLIGRWFAFEFKNDKPDSAIVTKFRIPRLAIDEHVSIYKFLDNEFYKKARLNFSNSLESIIDTTLDDSNLAEEAMRTSKDSTSDESFVCREIQHLKLRNGMSPILKKVNQIKTALYSTPILKRLTRRHS